jgi:hypothetical protein
MLPRTSSASSFQQQLFSQFNYLNGGSTGNAAAAAAAAAEAFLYSRFNSSPLSQTTTSAASANGLTAQQS